MSCAVVAVTVAVVVVVAAVIIIVVDGVSHIAIGYPNISEIKHTRQHLPFTVCTNAINLKSIFALVEMKFNTTTLSTLNMMKSHSFSLIQMHSFCLARKTLSLVPSFSLFIFNSSNSSTRSVICSLITSILKRHRDLMF